MSIRVPYDEMKETVKQAFLKLGLPEDKAEICAEVHTSSSADGVESHGMNRVPRFAQYVEKGWVDVNAEPSLVKQTGAVQIIDGHLGIGVTNALFCADRAVKLASEYGIGMVAIRNTTHWMRGGTYAWKIAEAGKIGITWTNTESCMPLWGSDKASVGNNPFCFAIPRKNGPIVVDMAMSQYAYGKINAYSLAGKTLPYPGGFDENGNLTNDPKEIEKTRRILPTGYWKGSSLAIALDLAAAAISNGMTGADMDDDGRGSCTGCSQIFIAIDPYLAGGEEEIQKLWDDRVARADAAHPIDPERPVHCPGESTLKRRKKNRELGVPVDEKIWAQIQALARGEKVTQDLTK
ncbi:MAG: 3-dehydro-L-gulonate 2-dehydrogenase [Lachnospiraceae bacterium]|jgi:3-dehydro-L-gulonate 2-dehydrogenase